MQIPEHIFKSYDIRALYPEEINEESIVPIVRSIYAFFLKKSGKTNPTVVLGRDMRTSSPSLHDVVIDTLIKMGANVVDVGLVSTPTFYFSVNHYKYDCGFQISASHNPKQWNGLKIVVNSEKGLIKIGKSTGMDEIKERALESKKADEIIEETRAERAEKGKVEEIHGVGEEEVMSALDKCNHPHIKPFKIVADAANAMGGTYLDALFKQIPGELVRMNFELDGTFPSHQPDPLQHETLRDLQAKVKEAGADLGLAPDGDGDRIFFIDEQGEIVQPSRITAIVAREWLKENKGGKILFDVRYVMTPTRVTEENGGEAILTKVGHAYISEKMAEVGGLFAGESSAHFFFGVTGNAEGPLLVVLTVLKVMTMEGKKLSELVEEVKRSEESGEINFKVKNAKEIMEKLKEEYKDGELNEIDGVAISYPEWRFSLRTSNTEPLLRLNVEEEIEHYQKRHEKLVERINEIAEHDTDSSSGH